MQPCGSLEGGLSELLELVQGRRVTSSKTSAALHLEPMREWGGQCAPPGAPEHERRASAGSSSSYCQWRESYVPGREAETLPCAAAGAAGRLTWLAPAQHPVVSPGAPGGAD